MYHISANLAFGRREKNIWCTQSSRWRKKALRERQKSGAFNLYIKVFVGTKKLGGAPDDSVTSLAIISPLYHSNCHLASQKVMKKSEQIQNIFFLLKIIIACTYTNTTTFSVHLFLIRRARSVDDSAKCRQIETMRATKIGGFLASKLNTIMTKMNKNDHFLKVVGYDY